MLIGEKKFEELYGHLYEEERLRYERYVSDPAVLCAELEASHLEENRSVLPVPSADMYEYLLTRCRGFVRFPERLKNKIVAEHSTFASHRDFLPMILDIEPASRCNFRCVMCQVNDWHAGKRADDLSYEDFLKIMKQQYGLVEVKLQGMGEPLLNKDFFKMSSYLMEHDIWTRTTVNGSILHINENYKKLVDMLKGEITASFDGATKEVFEKIRINSDFNKVVDNLTMLNTYANEKNILLTRMWVLVQNHNAHQINDFVDLAEQMKFKRLTYSFGMSDFGQDKWNKTNKNLEVKTFLSTEEAWALRDRAAKRGVDVTFWNLAEKYSTESPETLCRWPFTRAYVSSDMRIVPCCMIGNPDVADLGSAQDFTAGWNSPVYRKFRKAHLKGKIPGFCVNCYKDQRALKK